MSNPVPPPLDYDVTPPSIRKKFTGILLLIAILAIAGTGARSWWNDRAAGESKMTTPLPTASTAMDTLARAPTGVRIKVRVVNTTKSDGLARKATALLRDRGFDVVDYEGDSRKPLDTTVVLTHTGHDEWSNRAVRALGAGVVQSRPDSLRYLDLTVMLGRDWKAPSQPFRP